MGQDWMRSKRGMRHPRTAVLGALMLILALALLGGCAGRGVLGGRASLPADSAGVPPACIR